MSTLGKLLVRAGDAVEGEPASDRIEPTDIRDVGRRHAGPLESLAAIGRAGHEEDALPGLDIGADPEDVDRAAAIAADRAALPVAAEADVADVSVAEVGAGRGVVHPELLLVGEEGRALAAHDHRVIPSAGVPGRGGGNIIRARDGDGAAALECLLVAVGAEIGGDVGVVESRAVGPREAPVGGLVREYYREAA